MAQKVRKIRGIRDNSHVWMKRFSKKQVQVEGLGVAGKAHITITHAYTIFGVFGPLGGKKGDFRKIVKNAIRGSYEQCLYQFSAS